MNNNANATIKPTKTLRQSLTKHETELKDFASLFLDGCDYSDCVASLTDYAESLENDGVKSLSDKELEELVLSINEFQGYIASWSKVLKKYAKFA